MRASLWPLLGATLAVLLVAATATTAVRPAADTAASPLAGAGHSVPRTPPGRERKRILLVAQDGAVDGFNTTLNCCDETWALAESSPVIRGAFLLDSRLRHVRDLVSSAKATQTTLSYTIRKNAYWFWGGRKLPVTYRDFAYTWAELVNPANDVASRDGYDAITGYTHRGERQITFTWKQPYGDWQDLFRVVYPADALAGQDFNHVWTTCICGNDGKPISDGPFYLSSYTAGQGSTLTVNPYWYGRRPRLREIDFRVVTDTMAEVDAMKKGAVDVINPTFSVALLPLQHAHGISYAQVPGLFQEHIDVQLGSLGQPLLRAPWMRRALMLGIDRASIIRTLYGLLAGSTSPLDSLLYYQRDIAYRPDFARWGYKPRKALAILHRHCTGGPTHVGGAGSWVCDGFAATFRFAWTSSNVLRTTQEALIKSDLQRIGIGIVDAPLPASVVFGPSGIPAANYDLADFAWITTSDPSSFVPVWSCDGEANFMHYCNRRVSTLLEASQSEPRPPRRRRLLQEADRLLAADVPSIPLYSRPNPVVRRSRLAGIEVSPSPAGFTWNVEDWYWKR